IPRGIVTELRLSATSRSACDLNASSNLLPPNAPTTDPTRAPAGRDNNVSAAAPANPARSNKTTSALRSIPRRHRGFGTAITMSSKPTNGGRCWRCLSLGLDGHAIVVFEHVEGVLACIIAEVESIGK